MELSKTIKMQNDAEDVQLTLYSSQVSDCSARLRISLNLKKLPHELISISMATKGNRTSEYTAINPTQTVPTLVVKTRNEQPLILTQSLATLEYLEEAFPHTRSLLPPLDKPSLRAQVRTLVGIIATDIHPLTTPRVGVLLSVIASAEAKGDENYDMLGWDRHWMKRGLEAYESAMKGTCGEYSVGDNITLADVLLMPELWTSIRFGVDISPFPNISRIYRRLSELDEFSREQSRPE